MPGIIRTSRDRFRDYSQNLFQRKSKDDKPDDPLAWYRGRHRSSWQLLREFFGLIDGYWPSVAFALVMLTLSTGLGLIPPAATKLVVDNVLGDQPMPEWIAAAIPLPEERGALLALIIGVVVAISFVKVGFGLWGRWRATLTTKRVQMSVRKRVFAHAVRLPMHRVHDLKSGGIASILRNDSGSVGDLVFGLIYNPWRAAVQLIGSLLILAFVDWRLLVGAIAMLPVVYVTHRTWINRIRPQFKAVRATREEVDAQATESFGGMRVVRAFARERSEGTRNMKSQHFMGRQELYAWWWVRIVESIWETVIPLASAGLLLYGGWQVLEGSLTLGDLMMFLVYLLMLLEPIAVLAQSAAQFQNSLSGLDRILDVLAEPTEMPRPEDCRPLDRSAVAGRVTFDNVDFRYDTSEDDAGFSLREVSFEAEPGEVIALVGRSGAGKTTLCNLVARFYDATGGQILLDDVDVREYDVEQYRRLLGVVEQDVFLFDGTVTENIAYANRAADLTDIIRAARAANAHEFVERLPQGYETVIGERGVKLSGGQRQRLAIARAVLAEPKLLILDEATSNLDTESERLIQDALQNLMADRTSFVIAHRLSTIRHAHLILVIEDGRIVERGTHDELVRTGTIYPEMVALQTGRNFDVESSVSQPIG
ncbi:ABC transporter ATP-binding protein [Stratiformator vulcanicus]|uniref:Multidrug export ATP-binding/permease protein n=1 Tax=Stratiformator vulcanicus TaxID=2527980 RepID=A0A517QXW1_9PLAN|nr:ABC transporter ATP-binding protein [Stratiformator vulcanicus]QDT36443.1 Putative multidrug export ATP-binding/permease protein [Stratiformator vulcanicus]